MAASSVPLKFVATSIFIGLVLYYANAPVPDAFKSSPDRWRMRILAAGGDFVSIGYYEDTGPRPMM